MSAWLAVHLEATKFQRLHQLGYHVCAVALFHTLKSGLHFNHRGAQGGIRNNASDGKHVSISPLLCIKVLPGF